MAIFESGKRILLLSFDILGTRQPNSRFSPLPFPQQWIYGSISNGDLQKNSFIGMAYGPPAKKPKIQNEAANRREFSPPESDGMSTFLKTNVRLLF